MINIWQGNNGFMLLLINQGISNTSGLEQRTCRPTVVIPNESVTLPFSVIEGGHQLLKILLVLCRNETPKLGGAADEVVDGMEVEVFHVAPKG